MESAYPEFLACAETQTFQFRLLPQRGREHLKQLYTNLTTKHVHSFK